MMNKIYDIVGVGIGPFNLSLAALLSPLNELKVKFCDAQKEFSWHPELMFDDAPMQTSFLKDLVTPVQPTNPYSFLNYLVEKGQFYHFLNTSRSVITRLEFEAYLRWASYQLNDFLEFDAKIINVKKENNYFRVMKEDGEYLAKHICVASGPTPNIPRIADEFIGKDVFHAKSKWIKDVNMNNKKVLIVGGGQTGIEIFRNVLKEKWGKSKELKLISGRENLLPLDEGPFTNEIFSPDFVSHFYNLPQENKDSFTKSLLLASDGNTPSYLRELYNELYLDKFYRKVYSTFSISPMRWLEKIEKVEEGYLALIKNKLSDECEVYQADIIILATGFSSKLPIFLNSLKDQFIFDEFDRIEMSLDYKIKTKFDFNNIYAMNYSRHGHGIADPQTSLMSWRSAVIANSLLQREHFKNVIQETSFLQYFPQKEQVSK